MARAPQTCLRCNCTITQETGIVRRVCSNCDLELHTMHYGLEWNLFGKTTYMLPGEEPSLAWFLENKNKDLRDALKKGKPPAWRSWYRIPVVGKTRSNDNDTNRGRRAEGASQGGVSPSVILSAVVNEPAPAGC